MLLSIQWAATAAIHSACAAARINHADMQLQDRVETWALGIDMYFWSSTCKGSNWTVPTIFLFYAICAALAVPAV